MADLPMFELVQQWFNDSALLILFLSSFLSATLLPGGSEAALLGALALNHYSVISVVSVAAIGNTLGGLTNYAIGRWLPNRTDFERTESHKYSHKALVWLKKYGYWALLMSWLPLVGDPLCLAAGWLRMKLIPCIVLILVGKAIRYAVLTAAYFGFF